ncbi:hypothetical protein VCHENC02_2087A, partial [Vibrio harveyi]
MYQYHE